LGQAKKIDWGGGDVGRGGCERSKRGSKGGGGFQRGIGRVNKKKTGGTIQGSESMT